MRIKMLLLLFLCFGLTLGLQAGTLKRYHGVGVVKDVEKDGRVLVIQHEAIPGLMDAMTMSFELSDPKLAKGIKVGDHVRFTMVHKGNFWPIIALKRFKPRMKPMPSGSPAAKPAPTMAPM